MPPADPATTGTPQRDQPVACARVDRLVARIDEIGAPICVGLDPVLERLPGTVRAGRSAAPDAIERFCIGVIEAIADIAPAVKLQSACFERYASAGVGVLERVAEHARARGLWTILDAKRGDIGISAEHYAGAARTLGVDAITGNPYLGVDVLRPFLDAGLVVFALVRTSNPESDPIQTARVINEEERGTPGATGGGRTMASLVADKLATLGAEWVAASGLSAVGAVVGATRPDEGHDLRARMPDQPILVPGFGAQGGGIEGVRSLMRPNASGIPGVLVSASRSIIYPSQPGDAVPDDADWPGTIRDAASRFAEEIAAGMALREP